MASANEFRRVALALEGTTEAPHFDRRAFKARRIYTTLAPDGLTANIRFPPEEQEFRCAAQPEAYRPVPNKWGQSGWTIAVLAALTREELRAALASAWRYQAIAPKARARGKAR
jgi:hypothetical protein